MVRMSLGPQDFLRMLQGGPPPPLPGVNQQNIDGSSPSSSSQGSSVSQSVPPSLPANSGAPNNPLNNFFSQLFNPANFMADQNQPNQNQPNQNQPSQNQPNQSQPNQNQPNQNTPSQNQRLNQNSPQQNGSSQHNHQQNRPQVNPVPVQLNRTVAQNANSNDELDQAATVGNVNTVRTLVTGGANVNRGSLHKACIYGHKDVVIHLINSGAKPDVKLANGETAVHTCAYYGQVELLIYLLDQCGANLFDRTKDGKSALMLAVAQNHHTMTAEILKRGCSPEDNDVLGTTSLMLAAQRGNKEITELLFQAKANVDARDCKGRTALHFAASGGHPHILALLCKNKTSVDYLNCNKETPLHFASCHGKTDCVAYLLGVGADPNLVTGNGFTALQLARNRNFPEIVNLLQYRN
eukprot:TRINITY_DN2445_c0_g1_i2.p1 TRINITY_DN2445_c0_g1~~TRINITY_DN2445_c0_g1_i2.p1  ORF type:complete len:477 (+),score=120.48 TRINITY_DN2445_c0_g1_i2:206-1432(+)